jgi:hypothetical protein
MSTNESTFLLCKGATEVDCGDGPLGALYPSTWRLNCRSGRGELESYLLTYTFLFLRQHRSLLTSRPHLIHHSLYHTSAPAVSRSQRLAQTIISHLLRLGTPVKKAYLFADRHLHRLVSWGKHLSIQNRPQPRINIFPLPQPHSQWPSNPTPRSPSPTSSPMTPTSTAENAVV